MNITKTRSFVIISIFSLLSFLLSLVKFGGASSIAFDSFPSYFVAAYFTPLLGAPVAAIGHMASAVSGGFPFSFPVHLTIAIMQAVWAAVFGTLPRMFNSIYVFAVAAPVAVGLNGYVGPKILTILFPFLEAPINGLIPVLLLASAANVVLATFLVIVIRKFPVGRG